MNIQLSEEYINRAVQFLHQRGFVEGVDFARSEAVDRTNDIAFNEIVQEMIKHARMNNYLFIFEGMKEHEGCLGWDGVSDICTCGRVAVEWIGPGGFSFETPIIFSRSVK